MKKIIFLFFINILLFGNPAFSGTQVNEKTISKVAMGWGGEGVYVSVNGDFSPVENCTSTTFVMLPSVPLFKENFSVLLSAFHAGSKVQLYVEGCIGESMDLKAVGAYK